jgi:hypothetical protein
MDRPDAEKLEALEKEKKEKLGDQQKKDEVEKHERDEERKENVRKEAALNNDIDSMKNTSRLADAAERANPPVLFDMLKRGIISLCDKITDFLFQPWPSFGPYVALIAAICLVIGISWRVADSRKPQKNA